MLSGRHFPLARIAAAGLLAAGAAVLAISGRASSADADACDSRRAESQARQQIITGSGESVVVLGDSWSVGTGLDDTGSSWPRELPGRVTVLGFGGSGFTEHASPCDHVSFADRVTSITRSADLVVLAGGLNDFDQPAAEVRSGLHRALHELGNAEVVVVGPAAAPTRASEVVAVDGLLRAEAARAGIRYISTLDLRLPYLPDNLHLTADGHRQFGQAVAERLEDE